MSRIRTIHPSLPHEKALRDVSVQAKLLGVLLPLICDDKGRCRIDFHPMAEQVMPFVENAAFKIPVWFDELEGSGWVSRYEIDGVSYFRMPYWHEYQRIDRPTRSQLPGEPRKRGAAPREESEKVPATAASDTAPREDFLVGGDVAAREEAVEVSTAPASDSIPREDFFVGDEAATREERPEVPVAPASPPIPREASVAPSGTEPPLTPDRVLSVLHTALNNSLRKGGNSATPRYIELAGRHVGLWGGRGAPVGRKEPAKAQKGADPSDSAQTNSPPPDQIMGGPRSGS